MVSLVGSKSLESYSSDFEKNHTEFEKWVENCKDLYSMANKAENKGVMSKMNKVLDKSDRLKAGILPVSSELSLAARMQAVDLNALTLKDGIEELRKAHSMGLKKLKQGKEEFEAKDDESIKRAKKRREKERQRLLQHGSAKPPAKPSFKKEEPIEPIPELLAVQEPELSEAEASGEESSAI